MTNINDLGLITNIEVIQKFVELDGRMLVDAGCGDMTVSKMLAECGAHVLAIDPDPVQAEKNRKADAVDGIEFVECGADLIPADDESVDGVFFSYSLHHIPQTLYPAVFEEVIRVLKPGGFIYVIEPIDCPLNRVMVLFHDEEKERAAAQKSLHEIAKPHFESAEEVTYHSFRKFESFEEFAKHYTSRSFNSLYSEADVRADKVREAFEKLGEPDYTFSAPKQVMVLKGLVK